MAAWAEIHHRIVLLPCGTAVLRFSDKPKIHTCLEFGQVESTQQCEELAISEFPLTSISKWAKPLLWISVFTHIEIRTNYQNKNFALSLPLKERIQHRLTILTWIDLIHNSSRKRSKATFSPCNPNNDRHRNMILMRSPHLQLLIKKPTYASAQTEKGKRQTPMETH